MRSFQIFLLLRWIFFLFLEAPSPLRQEYEFDGQAMTLIKK